MEIAVEVQPKQRSLDILGNALGTLGCRLGLAGVPNIPKIRSLDLTFLELRRDNNDEEYRLVGLNGEVDVTSRVVDSAVRDPGVFSYAVRGIAANRLTQSQDTEATHEQQLAAMRVVRDELKAAVDIRRS